MRSNSIKIMVIMVIMIKMIKMRNLERGTLIKMRNFEGKK